MNIIIFDTETTGLLSPSCSKQQPRIIELGAIKLDCEANIIGKLSQLINPEIEIPKKIVRITGISQSFVDDQPTFKDFSETLVDFFKDVDIMICHNASFDIGVLKYEFEKIGVDFKIPNNIVCTVLEYQHIFGGYVKLKDMYSYFLGKDFVQKHRALDDCLALYEILKSQDNYNFIGGGKYNGY
jgi:DNA polymerase-3 subunit alpha (Gram-positive type)